MRNTLIYTNQQSLGYTVARRSYTAAPAPAPPALAPAPSAPPAPAPHQRSRNTIVTPMESIFSVSAMFRVRSGKGCGGCGH
jgi:hypothetical protein